jgi:hypothetical protein
MASKKVRVTKKKAALAAPKKRAAKKATKASRAKAGKKKRKARAGGEVDEISRLTSSLVRYLSKSGRGVHPSRVYAVRALVVAREPGASTRPDDQKRSKSKRRGRTT